MNTIEICEHLLFKIPKIRNALFSLNIISNERNIAPVEHNEFNNIISDFENPRIISAIGIVCLTIIIEPKIISRKYNIIIINGYSSEKMILSKTGICDLIYRTLNIRDFLPMPLTKKIIYISDFSKMEGVIFSEYSKNLWTINDPMLLPSKNTMKTNVKNIIDKIVCDALVFNEPK